MITRVLRMGVIGVTLLVWSGCATGASIGKADDAAKRGDWDAAVAYYREVYSHNPSKIEVRISLERAMREASSAHIKRARDLEAQDQLTGAAAEYKLAADLDPSATLAMTKALELQRKIRDQIEAARPKSQIDQMRAQAAANSPIPRLDPRSPVRNLNWNGSVRELLLFIGEQTGITVQFDAENNLSTIRNPYTLTVQEAPLEQVLYRVLTANTLTYKVLDSKTIFVYADNQQGRQKYEDIYVQTFYISNAELNDLQQIIQQVASAQGTGFRPNIIPNKGSNTLVVRATAPVMGIIDQVIRANDKPKAEVIVDVEILEVDRTRTRQLGLDLSQYALGFTLTPESAPPNTATTAGAFPAQPPPVTLNTFTNGLRTSDFYTTIPTAMIKMLESDEKTRLLAKPQLRGREGEQLTLNLGQDIPIATTTFQAAAAGGANNIPATQIAYRTIGVILSMTPQVTYQDEIVLKNLSVENSSVGPNVLAGGQPTLSFVDRRANVTMRLRDGESNMLAGLVSEEDRKTYKTIPGFSSIPVLRLLFGNVDSSHTQTDIVMIVTPHIVRSHDITTEDLKPLYVGTQQNIGASPQPQLISPGEPIRATPPPPAGTTTSAPPPAGGATTSAPPPVSASNPPPSSNPRIVAVEPVTDTAPNAAPPAQVVLTAPTTPLQAGGPPYTTTLTATQLSQVGTITVTLTYDPKVLKAVNTSEGTFMKQGGVQTTYAPKIDALLGRVDIAITRGDSVGATGTGYLGAVNFEAVAAGTTQVKMTVVAMTAAGKPIAVTTQPVTITVK